MTASFNAQSGLHLPQPAAGDPVKRNDLQGAVNYDGHAASQNTANASNASSGQPQPSQNNDQTDDLDKEWISKAKLIVEQTKQDPFMQSREIGRAKADYLRIRFNKHIKLGPDQTL